VHSQPFAAASSQPPLIYVAAWFRRLKTTSIACRKQTSAATKLDARVIQGHLIPVHQLPESRNIIGTSVLIREVVRMFPHIDP
jgi:hypothetical protein